ncbi:MAG: SAF domain-containing protein [Actinobacteria bacterium]|nr:SAF domain-containing protein [Actinomycetota bacterium]
MLWLQTPPWGRRLAAMAIVVVAIWIELGPRPVVEHPFATTHIPRGTAVSSENTEIRSVPQGLLTPVALGSVARRDIAEGDPVLTTDLGEHSLPEDWWTVSIELPVAARAGDTVRIVMLDTRQVFEGIVVSSGDSDTLNAGLGAVALPGDDAALVAPASQEGRVAVLVSTG